jgi:ribonuclease VapC
VVIDTSALLAILQDEPERRAYKGRHVAGLNFGDCFSYALSQALGEPLLYKGEDFSRTDVVTSRPPTA